MKSLLLVLLFSLTSFALVPGGDHVGSGGGIAEKNVVFAYTNLDKYIGLCLGSEACRLQPEEKILLKAIRAGLPQEGPADLQIVFVSGKSKPDFFLLEGQIKIAKTGETIGSQIFVNLDLLYTKGPEKMLTPLSLGAAVALMVHELGHHHGEKSHLKLDLLGSKVESMLAAHSQHLVMAPYRWHIFASVLDFEPNPVPTFNQLLAGDGKNLYDLSERLRTELTCHDMDPNWKLVGLRLSNLHWARDGAPHLADLTMTQSFWARLNRYCETAPNHIVEEVSTSVKVTLKFSISTPVITMLPYFKFQLVPDAHAGNCR